MHVGRRDDDGQLARRRAGLSPRDAVAVDPVCSQLLTRALALARSAHDPDRCVYAGRQTISTRIANTSSALR